MLKIKIIIQKEQDGKMVDYTIEMVEVESCEEIIEWDNRLIDYAYSYEENPKYRYFDIVLSGEHKTLAVNGKVELTETPVVENSIQVWNKKNNK